MSLATFCPLHMESLLLPLGSFSLPLARATPQGRSCIGDHTSGTNLVFSSRFKIYQLGGGQRGVGVGESETGPQCDILSTPGAFLAHTQTLQILSRTSPTSSRKGYQLFLGS